jgi:Uncharacterised nucleotidyltransferase
MRRGRDWIGTTLRACVLEHDWSRTPAGLAEVVAGRDLGGLVERATHHGVGNLVYLSSRSIQGLDPAALSGLERHYNESIARHLRALADLSNLSTALRALEVPWLLFKGPILSEIVYPRPDLRSYLDLDILVPRQHFSAAVAALQGHGAHLLDKNWDLLLRRRVGQVHLELPFGTLADVHWHIVNRSEIRRSLQISTSGLFSRARTVTIGGRPVQTFDPVDSLLHLCTHAALSGGVRLAWLKDIERAAALRDHSWEAVLERATEWRAAAPVAAVLARVNRFFGAQVAPNEFISQLAPSRLARAADAALDILYPVESLATEGGLAAYWIRYRRDSFAAGSHTLRARASFRGSARGASGVDGREMSAALIPSGDDRTREAFFDMVSRSAEG